MDTGGISLRPATVDDAAGLTELAARLTAFELPRWRTSSEIVNAELAAMQAAVRAGDPDSEVFIAERGGICVGCLHVLKDVDFFGRAHAHVSVVSVTEAAQGTGVGRALLAHADRWAHERGLGFVTLNVFADNARARRLYERVGFETELVKYVKVLG